MFRKYETKNVNEVVYAEVIKVFFKDLFDYKPSLYDNGELVDLNSWLFKNLTLLWEGFF